MSNADKTKAPEVVLLKKWHLVLALIFMIATPAVSVTAAYYSRESAVKQMISVVEKQSNEKINTVKDRVADLELNTEKEFVRKDDFSDLSKKIEVMAQDLGEIKGYIRSMRRTSRSQ